MIGILFLITGVPDFGYIGIHVKPDDAPSEIDALVDVYNVLKSQWGIDVNI